MALPVLSSGLCLVVPVIALIAVAACSGVEIVGANKTHVWVRNPMLGLGDSNELAQRHCSLYDKTAVLENDLSVADGANSILVYTCN